MQQYRHEDILQAYYPHSFTFHREDVMELDSEGFVEIPDIMCDPETNELFVKSKVYVDENEERHSVFKYYRHGSPRKRNDWKSEGTDHKVRQDDVRLRDKHYKKKKREDVPIWTVPPQ